MNANTGGGRASRLSSRDESPHDRYCKMCQRNTFHCKRCKHKCHKKCPGHTHHCRKLTSSSKRTSSYNKIYAGDEHWTKVLQTNEAEVPRCERHCLFHPFLHSPLSATERDYMSSFRYQSNNSASISRASSSLSRYNFHNNYRNNNNNNNNNMNMANGNINNNNNNINLINNNNNLNNKMVNINNNGDIIGNVVDRNGYYINKTNSNSNTIINNPNKKYNSAVSSYNSYLSSFKPATTPLVLLPQSQISNHSQSHPQSPKLKSPKPIIEKTSTQQSIQNSSKEKNVFHNLVARFVSLFDSNKQEPPKPQDIQKQPIVQNNGIANKSESDSKTIASASDNVKNGDRSTTSTFGCIGFPQGESLKYKKDQKRTRRRAKTIATSATSISSSDCDTTDSTTSTHHHHRLIRQHSWWRRNESGMLSRPSSTSTTCSSMMMTSSCTSPATSDCFIHDSAAEFSPCRRPTSFKFSLSNPPGKQFKFRNNIGAPYASAQKSPQDVTSPSNMSTTTNSSSYGSLSSLSSQVSPEKMLDVTKETLVDVDLPNSAQMRRAAYKAKQSSKGVNGSFISNNNNAWLSKDTLINSSSLEKDSMDASDTMSLCSMFDNCDQYMKDTLEDWNIPLTDLVVQDLIRAGLTFNIHKGRWHGNVFVYKFNTVSESRASNFLKEVTRLSKIRHENVCLFMGASVSPTTMAIVTSELKGISVYDRIHLTNDRMPSRLRLSISEHVAQAIGYLHAKKIVVRSVNTRNVYFDPKVKLSLLDHSSPQLKHSKSADTACFSRGVLSYYAPELLKKIRPSPHEWEYIDEKEFNTQTDLFAFGTFLYEVMSGQLAMRNMSVDELMWKVVSGVRQPIKHLNAHSLLRTLIDRCWSDDPDRRPTFNEINSDFMKRGHLI